MTPVDPGPCAIRPFSLKPLHLAVVLAAALLAGCTTPGPPLSAQPAAARQPANLHQLKRELVEYVDSGNYGKDVAAVAGDAEAWVNRRAHGDSSRLAIVFDLDETLLSNLEHMREMDFGYVPGLWSAWVAESRAPALEPVARVYRAARARGVAVFFLTGRRERECAATEANLRAAGLGDFAGLHCKPDDDRGTTQAFKTSIRQKITADGYTIIANIGDQQSDLDGGYSERTFKVPNPFYLTF